MMWGSFGLGFCMLMLAILFSFEGIFKSLLSEHFSDLTFV
jgi:hypothetical protein